MKPTPILNPGAIPSAPDYRLQIVAAAMAASSAEIAASLPAALQTDFQKLGILNQAKTPACVSHAMVGLMKLWWFLKTGTIVNFSARFLHNLSGLPQYNGGQTFGPNDGRDPITVARVAMKYGCATEATCPNDTTLDPAVYFSSSAITQTMLTEAVQYKIPGFVQIPANQLAFRQAIQKYGAISMMFRISNSFWTDIAGNTTWSQAAIDPVRAPRNEGAVIGGHELIGSGWDQSLDHLVNSWSSDWAEDGESDYLWNEWSGYIIEGLAIAEVDTDTLNLIQGLPRPGEFVHTFTQPIIAGQTSSEVRALQIALAIDGDFTNPEITSFYGPVTQAAVLAFQLKYQVADVATLQQLAGKNVGPATRAALNKLFSKSA